MFKQVTPAILAAAVIAGIFTAATGSSKLDASPIGEPAHSAIKACTQQAWPYLDCVGTPYGDQKVRVIKAN